MSVKIALPQLQRVIEAEVGDNLLTLLRRASVPVAHSCAGEGICGTCRVRIEGVKISSPSNAEQQLSKRHRCPSGTRFACLVTVESDCKVTTDYW